MTDSEVTSRKGVRSSYSKKASLSLEDRLDRRGRLSPRPDSMVGVETSSPLAMDRKDFNNSILNENEAVDNAGRGNRMEARPLATLKGVNRPSPNCGVFDYKHPDTEDSDNNNAGDLKTVVTHEEMKEERTVVRVQRKYRSRTSSVRRKMDFSCDEDVDHEALQQIIDSAIMDQDWLNSNITTDSEEDSLIEDTAPPAVGVPPAESMDTESGEENSHSLPPKVATKVEGGVEPAAASRGTPYDKESLHRLISDAEQLVREPLKDARSALKPLPLGVPRESKQHRIKQWLSAQCEEEKEASHHLQDSCDASGELTTGESDLESDPSDNDLDISSATQKGSADLLLSSENTPTIERLPALAWDPVDKDVILRGKKRQQKEQRPWSVTDAQLISRMKNNPALSPANGCFEARKTAASAARTALSASESALNSILASTAVTAKQSAISTSDPMVSSSACANSPSPPYLPLTSPQSPTVTSTTLLNQSSTASQGTGRTSPPSLPTSGSMRRRRSKFRRRSNQFLSRRTDSGSDDLNSSSKLCGRGKDSNQSLPFSPYHHSITKSLSSESESVSGCPRVVKSSSFSGGCIGQNGGMTSSTEKCLSDSSMVSGTGQAAPLSVPEEEAVASPRSGDGNNQVLSPRRGLLSDQEASTHQEDVSSLSEQAWDPYQEFKYLSEPYSEDLDNDAARRLLDFGDDYRKYIDSDGSSFMGLPYRRHRSPPLRRLRANSRHLDSDSDSELEDLHQVIEECKSQLIAMESVFEKHSSQATLGLDFSELLTIASSNLKSLHCILKDQEMRDEPRMQAELKDVKSIAERWDSLQKKAMERQRQSTQLRQLQRQVKTLRLNMEDVVSRCGKYAHPHAMDDPALLPVKVEEVKALLEETESLRSDLSSLNVMVHRFTSEVGSSFTPLKDEMAELYRLWDETHRRVSGELSRMQSAETTWRLWEEQKTEFSQALKQDSDTLKVIDAAIDNGRLTETVTASVHDVAKLLNERRMLPNGKAKNQVITIDASTLSLKDAKSKSQQESKEDRLSDSGTSGYESCSSDDLSERERRLAYLRRLARDLESSLVPGSKAWNDISSTLAEAEKELQDLQDHCRSLILRTAETLDPTTKQPRFSSNSKRRNWTREGKSCRSPRLERRARGGGGGAVGGVSRREWIWRVVRAALPFQAALLLLLCVTCLLEPNCCDSVNTLNRSFTPQFRFVHGSTPI